MSNISIPVAQDPHGNPVPIEEAVRYKTNYYRCPECQKIVNPRKGEQRKYYAHKAGVLEEVSCSLSSQADVEKMVDELRTSDVEKDEQNQNIRIYIGQTPGEQIECFGIMPSIEWDHVPLGSDIDTILSRISVTSEGIQNPPVPANFHPSESEVVFKLDPVADEFTVSLEGGEQIMNLNGTWTVDGLGDGDIFLGDQTRARRYRDNRQVKQNEWVYLVTESLPKEFPDIVTEHSLGDYSVLAFPAREETKPLLEDYGEGLTTDDFGFDADLILPADAHPTIEAPIESAPNERVLIGVTPSEEIDPHFELVSVPRRETDKVDIEPTGPGNPRYHATRFPKDGSKRVSIHQRNSNRHRLVHLHATTKGQSDTLLDDLDRPKIGFVVETDQTQEFLSPLTEDSVFRFPPDLEPLAFPTRIGYVGPQGLEIEITAKFESPSPHGSRVTRSTTTPSNIMSEIEAWAQEGCQAVEFSFDGIGSVTMEFDISSRGGLS
jgi:hypothetical protein